VLLDEPLFNCLTNRLSFKSLLQWPKHVIVTRGDIGAVRWVIQITPANTERVSHVAWAACGLALSWSISTPRESFPVIQGQLLALLPNVSMFHLNNPYMFVAATVFKMLLHILKGFPLIVIPLTSFELENKYSNEVKPQPEHQIMSGNGTSHPARLSYSRSSGCRLEELE
jgi:hypothetical protein